MKKKTSKQLIIKMIERGMSYNAAAKYYGVSRQWARMIYREHLIANSIALEKHKIIKYNSHSIVTQAIACGALIPEPCEVCGVFGKDETGNRKCDAHHDDYTKPLDVRWLCRKHHAEWHKNNEAIK